MPFPWWVIVIIVGGVILLIVVVVVVILLVVKLSASKAATISAYNYHREMDNAMMENLYSVPGREANMGRL